MSKCPHLTRLGESGPEHTGLTAPPCLQFPLPFKDRSLKRTQKTGMPTGCPPPCSRSPSQPLPGQKLPR